MKAVERKEAAEVKKNQATEKKKAAQDEKARKEEQKKKKAEEKKRKAEEKKKMEAEKKRKKAGKKGGASKSIAVGRDDVADAPPNIAPPVDEQFEGIKSNDPTKPNKNPLAHYYSKSYLQSSTILTATSPLIIGSHLFHYSVKCMNCLKPPWSVLYGATNEKSHLVF